MKLPKLVLMQFAKSLMSKTDEQLQGLLNHYQDQLNRSSSDKEAATQKIELVKQEIAHRQSKENAL